MTKLITGVVAKKVKVQFIHGVTKAKKVPHYFKLFTSS